MADNNKVIVELGTVMKNRGEYNPDASPLVKYYKDNIVQKQGSSYIAQPTALVNDGVLDGKYYLTRAPFSTDPQTPNAGWEIFASGKHNFSTGEDIDSVDIASGINSGDDGLVKSGDVFDRFMQSGVFDLTAYSGDTYEDLPAALTALNALSAAYKKPGMSFKFVQTSDNKYVQARCMAQNFTTDVTQWQGVDVEPTKNSHNFVESGGVYKIEGYFENTDVAVETSDNRYKNYNIPAGSKIIIKVDKISGTSSTYKAYWIKDTDVSILDNAPMGYVSDVLVVPEDATGVKIFMTPAGEGNVNHVTIYDCSRSQYLIEKFKPLEEKVSNVQSEIHDTIAKDFDYFDKDSATRINGFVSGDIGSTYTATPQNTWRSYKVPVSGNGFLEYWANYSSLNSVVLFINDSDIIVDKIPVLESKAKCALIPSTATYALIPIHTDESAQKFFYAKIVGCSKYELLEFASKDNTGISQDGTINSSITSQSIHYYNVEGISDVYFNTITASGSRIGLYAFYKTLNPTSASDVISVESFQSGSVAEYKRGVIVPADAKLLIVTLRNGQTQGTVYADSPNYYARINESLKKGALNNIVASINSLNNYHNYIDSIIYKKSIGTSGIVIDNDQRAIVLFRINEYSTIEEILTDVPIVAWVYYSDVPNIETGDHFVERNVTNETSRPSLRNTSYYYVILNISNGNPTYIYKKDDSYLVEKNIGYYKDIETLRTSYKVYNGRILSTNTWSTDASLTPRSIFIPNRFYNGKIKIGTTLESNAKIAFVKSIPSNHGDSISYCTGTSLITVDKPLARVYTIPSDCNYIYVLLSLSNTDMVKYICDGLLGEVHELVKEDTCSVLHYNQKEVSQIESLDKQPPLTGGAGFNKKHFVFAQITDSHEDTGNTVSRLVDFVNTEFGYENIDLIIHTGDVEYNSWSGGQEVAYWENVNRSTKPFLFAVGNHDESSVGVASDARGTVFDRWMQPMIDNGTLVLDTNISQDETYYFYDIPSYKIRIIVLNDFEPVYDTYYQDFTEGTERSVRYGQEQCDFLVSALNSVPEDYTVIIAKHTSDNSVDGTEGLVVDNVEWSISPNTISSYHDSELFSITYHQDGRPHLDIINAYMNKTTINKHYNYTTPAMASNLPEGVTVNADFSNANGTFGFIVVGHRHLEFIGHDKEFPNIKTICCLNAGAIKTSAGQDVGRTKNRGKNQDSFSVYVVDTTKRLVHIVKFGANFTFDGKERNYTKMAY